MFVVDTNILLYAVNPDSAEHVLARAAVDRWHRGADRWFITWGIAYEFLRVSTHPRVFANPLTLDQAWAWLTSLLTAPDIGVLTETDRHALVLTELARSHPRLRGNPVHDLHTATLMREHGISEIQTADTDFHQFPFLTVINPLVR